MSADEKTFAQNAHEVGHKLGDTYRGIVNMFTSTGSESKFLSHGTLTTDEFVDAGEQLVYKFPTWQWVSAASPSYEVGHLPSDKQYLITRGVPCTARVQELDEAFMKATYENQEGGDDWLVTGQKKKDAEGDGEAELDLSQPTANAPQVKADDPPPPSGPAFMIQEDFLDTADAPDLNIGGGQGDYIVCAAPPEEKNSATSSRSYDLSITYDKYYQTPRLWLFGYGADGSPLKPAEIFEDVLSEYKSRTVTVDPHPHSGIPTASIHPCKHAELMKRVVDDWVSRGVSPRPDLAIFVFLKFISGVVPTINYDFTTDVEMLGKKEG